MDKQLQQIKEFLKANKDYNKDSFYTDPIGVNYINVSHVHTWGGNVKPDIDIIIQVGTQSYVSIKDARELLGEQNNVRKVEIADFLEAFGLIKTIESQGVRIINETTLSLSKQYCFAYSIFNFLKTNYPELKAQMEYEIFKKLGICPHAIKGPRIDIYIESLKLAIEFDEDHHSSYENKFSDSHREKFLIAYGLNVVRCAETDEIWPFIKTKLIPQIKFLDIVYTSMDSFGSKLIDDLVANGCGSRDKIGLLVNEQMLDIIESKPIGEQIRNISLQSNIFEWLQIVDQDLQAQIYEIIEDLDTDEPVEQIDSGLSDTSDYLLSPNAFLAILDSLDGSSFPELYMLRKSGHKIRHRLLKLCADGFGKIKSITEKQNTCIPTIADYHYVRGRKDTDSELREKDKQISKLCIEVEFYKKILDEQFPELATRKKKPIKPILNFVLEPGALISEELDLIYTGDPNDMINVDNLKYIHELKSKQNKIKKSPSKCIETVRTRLGINKNELTSQSLKYIFKCATKNTYENKKIKEYINPKYTKEITDIQFFKSKNKLKKPVSDFVLDEDSSDDSDM